MIEFCAQKEGEATEIGDYKTNNKYARYEEKCLRYLFEHNQLRALHHYLGHDNHRVRLSAAYALLPLFEEESRNVLSEIADGNYRFSSLSAEMILRQWDEGTLKHPYDDEKSTQKKEVARQPQTNDSKETASLIPASLVQRMAKLFGYSLEDDYEKVFDQIGVEIFYDTDSHEVVFNINTFVNPYTQDVETVYRDRVNRFKAFEPLATVSADNPSKLGFMKITLKIHQHKATDNLILRIKDAIDQNNREWEKHECKVCSKAIYNGAECYFEGSWWYVHRAVIMNKKSYERYDFSDEMEFDEDMWDIETGGYDNLEFEDSFTLISPSEFQKIWDSTPREHKPKQR